MTDRPPSDSRFHRGTDVAPGPAVKLQLLTLAALLLVFATSEPVVEPRMSPVPADPVVVQPATGTAFPEGEAAVEEVLLQFDPAYSGELFTVYRDLVRALDPTTRFTVAVAEEHEAVAARFLLDSAGAAPSRYRVLVCGVPLTIWARDRTIPLLRDGRREFFHPARERTLREQAGDLTVAPALAGMFGGTTRSDLVLEGGNVVVGSGHVFVGGTVLAENPDFPGGKAGIAAALRTMFGREPTFVCTDTLPPHPHIDMYLTAIGENTVLLADPRLGLELLRALRVAGLCSIFDANWGDLSESGLEQLVPVYEGVRAQLVRHGLRVVRLPILHTADQRIFTWNNAIVEARNGTRRAYVPVYGIPRLDDLALTTYRKLGIVTHPIDVSRIAHMGGTVRCATNVLAWKHR